MHATDLATSVARASTAMTATGRSAARRGRNRLRRRVPPLRITLKASGSRTGGRPRARLGGLRASPIPRRVDGSRAYNSQGGPIHRRTLPCSGRRTQLVARVLYIPSSRGATGRRRGCEDTGLKPAARSTLPFQRRRAPASPMAESKKARRTPTSAPSRAKQRFRELQQRTEDDEEDVGIRDFSSLPLKPDHAQRPLWVCPDGAVFLEASSSLYAAAYDFLVAVAEPVARPEHVHQYKLTPHSLYAAVAVGITPASICDVLDKLSKVKLPEDVKKYILQCTKNFGRAKLVLRDNRHHVESGDAAALRELLAHRPIRNCRDELPEDGDRFEVGTAQQEIQANRAYLDIDIDGDSSEEEEKVTENINALRTYSFRLKQGTAQDVKKYASQDLDFPLAEEYDFRRDPFDGDVTDRSTTVHENPKLPGEVSVKNVRQRPGSFRDHRAALWCG